MIKNEKKGQRGHKCAKIRGLKSASFCPSHKILVGIQGEFELFDQCALGRFCSIWPKSTQLSAEAGSVEIRAPRADNPKAFEHWFST
jgi:hypothetical protein